MDKSSSILREIYEKAHTRRSCYSAVLNGVHLGEFRTLSDVYQEFSRRNDRFRLFCSEKYFEYLWTLGLKAGEVQIGDIVLSYRITKHQ